MGCGDGCERDAIVGGGGGGVPLPSDVAIGGWEGVAAYLPK